MREAARRIVAPIAGMLALAHIPIPALAEGNIVIAALESEAAVTPRPARLQLVDLPLLQFALRAAIRCKGEAVSVTLSVADTFVTFGRDQLAERRAVESTLSVPSSQVPLAAGARFCVAGDPESKNELLVTGLATAHASLQCASEAGMSVHYASAPLNVRLACARDEASDQMSSPLPEAR